MFLWKNLASQKELSVGPKQIIKSCLKWVDIEAIINFLYHLRNFSSISFDSHLITCKNIGKLIEMTSALSEIISTHYTSSLKTGTAILNDSRKSATKLGSRPMGRKPAPLPEIGFPVKRYGILLPKLFGPTVRKKLF